MLASGCAGPFATTGKGHESPRGTSSRDAESGRNRRRTACRAERGEVDPAHRPRESYPTYFPTPLTSVIPAKAGIQGHEAPSPALYASPEFIRGISRA